MMRQARPGFWVPNNFGGGWLFKDDPESNLPSHAREHVSACLKVTKRRRGTVIDGGAFVGSWTVLLAPEFKRVICFEPVPENFACLARNIDRLTNVEIHQKALTEVSGPLAFRFAESRKAYSWQVTKLGEADADPKHELMGQSIDDLNLDSCDLIKLDLEGHELAAVKGALNTINKFKPAIILESKFDEDHPARNMLLKMGMECVWEHKHDYLLVWN